MISSVGSPSFALQQAVQISMLKKQMSQEELAGQFVKDMMQGVAEVSGKGQALDIRG